MAQRSSTRNILQQHKNQSSDPSSSSSSSRSASAEHQLRSSTQGQTQSLRELSFDPHQPTSSKGKASQRLPASESAPMDPYIGTSRGGNMMGHIPALVNHAEEITYTPTTHRISKAKKGKKVHVCTEFGCGKVFTRAEHRKRHEANHRSEPLYKCQVEECRKPFQRIDLLVRHEERQHNIHQPSGSVRSQRRRTSSPASSIATSSQANSPMATAGMARASPLTSPGAATPSGAAMSIGSIITPTTRDFSHQELAWSETYQTQFTMPPRYPPELIYGPSAAEDSPFYSSDSCYSPISETPHSQANAQPYLPHYDKSGLPNTTYPMDYDLQMTAPMAAVSDFGPWAGLEGNVQSADGLGIGFEGHYPNPVGISLSACTTHDHPVDSLAESSTPTPLTFLERNGGIGLQVGTSHAAGLVANEDGVVELDTETLKHYQECYWKFFHPQFPLVHRPTMLYNGPESLLNITLLAIGAQYSILPHAKAHSTIWFNIASKSCLAIDPSTVKSGTPLGTLQVILLLQILGLYRSQSPGVFKLAQFDALYSSLFEHRKQLKVDPAAYFQKLPANANGNLLQSAYDHWIESEARLRLLLSAFIIDTQRSTLFQQQPSLVLHTLPSDLPTPCTSTVWEADLTLWFDFIAEPIAPTISPFSHHIFQCLTVATSSTTAASDLTSHALLMATHTPISALLTIAAESWLFARKLENPSSWTDAKVSLRLWVQSDEASKALWHAGHVLRTHFSTLTTEEVCEVGLHTGWCIYLAALVCWAYGFSVSAHFRQQSLSSSAYLQICDVRAWKEVERMRGRGGTRGVLMAARVAFGGKGKGSLLAEGGRVLERLVEGRGRLSWF